MKRMRDRKKGITKDNEKDVIPTKRVIPNVIPIVPPLPVIKFDLGKVLAIQKKMADYYDANRRKEQW